MSKEKKEAEEAKANPVTGEGIAPQEDTVETVNFPAFINDKPIVKLSELQAGRVVVMDDKGNFLYLAPTHDRNEYVLRPVPDDR